MFFESICLTNFSICKLKKRHCCFSSLYETTSKDYSSQKLNRWYWVEATVRSASQITENRKMKLSSFINRQQSDKRLARNLRKKFGDDAVITIGNWTVGNVKFHEPIRGIRMRRRLPGIPP
ncbi:hypothetical protein K7432_005041 [Basidiobolus ranarum]|uniref:Uncharacterized protein n=1 Tax=Basidiobolus ranarum TaxID=34480 RepID=A0ABR2WX68_9FUNG